MAFTKKPKLCQDAPATYQYFNGAAESMASFKQDLESEHTPLQGELQSPSSGIDHGNFEGPLNPLDALDGSTGAAGRHDHPLIARGAAYVAQTSSLTSPGVTTFGVQIWQADGCLQSLQVLGVGVYFFPITGFTKVWGKATPWHVGLGPIRVADPKVGQLIALDARVQPATPLGAGSSGLIVKTFMVQTVSGQLILAPYHTGFYVVAFGRRDEQPAQPAPGPLRMSRPPWTVRGRRFGPGGPNRGNR